MVDTVEKRTCVVVRVNEGKEPQHEVREAKPGEIIICTNRPQQIDDVIGHGYMSHQIVRASETPPPPFPPSSPGQARGRVM